MKDACFKYTHYRFLVCKATVEDFGTEKRDEWVFTVTGYEEGIVGVELFVEYGEADLGGDKGGGVVINGWG